MDKALDPTEVNKKPGIPFCKDIIKEEPKEQDDNQDPNPAELHTDKESVQEKEKQREIDINQMNISDEIQEKITGTARSIDIEEKNDEGLKMMDRELKVSLIRFEVDEHGEVKWTKDLLEKLKSSNEEYDSDETVIYHPGRVIRPKPLKMKYVEHEHGTASTVPRWLIRAHLSRAGFRISVHGIRRKKKRTYLACKIPGCKASFPSVRDWNSHHRLMHKETHLTCMECKKKFNMPSFL